MIDLKPFCASADDMRTYLHAPWRTVDGIVATNGHIIICVPDEGGDYPGEPKTIKNVVASLTKKYPAGEFLDLKSITLPPKIICETCKGTGHYRIIDCEDCDGDGEFYHGNHYYHCKECDGEGSVRAAVGRPEQCDDCGGMGEKSTIIDVGSSSYQRKYLAQLQALPNCRISPIKNSGSRFEFDGGFGWLMPCNK